MKPASFTAIYTLLLKSSRARKAWACGAPWVRTFGKLYIRENVVMT